MRVGRAISNGFLLVFCSAPVLLAQTQGRRGHKAGAVGASHVTDQLVDVVKWVTTDGDRSYVAHESRELSTALRQVVPNARIADGAEFSTSSTPDAQRRIVTPSAVVVDLDGDGAREGVFLVGITDRNADTLDYIIAVRQTAGGLVPTLLFTGESVRDNNGKRFAALSLQRLTAAGKSAATGGTTWWIRYQDDDCKSRGWQWTLSSGAWKKSKSGCNAGE